MVGGGVQWELGRQVPYEILIHSKGHLVKNTVYMEGSLQQLTLKR